MSPLQDNHAFWLSSEAYVSAAAEASEAAASLCALAQRGEATRGLIFFSTSGSEGVPKWVGHMREGVLASARAVNAHLEVTARDRWLIALPLHHMGGFSILARCFASGASFVRMEEKWEAAKFAKLCGAEKITLTSLVPTQVFDLVQAKIQAPAPLRAVVVGGAGLSKDVGLEAQRLGWPVLQSYGMTETASQVATEPLDHLYQGFDPDCLEVLPIWELATDEAETLTVRGTALARGYAIREGEGWRWQPMDAAKGLRTRDRAQLWTHGTRRFMRFLGRESSFLKIKGELVNLAALQKRLDEEAALAELAPGTVLIWPMPDARRESQLILVGAVSEVLLGALRERFNAAVRAFERVSRVQHVAEIPRTAVGKIDRMALETFLGRHDSAKS